MTTSVASSLIFLRIFDRPARAAQRFVVHVGEGQHLAGSGVLDDGGSELIVHGVSSRAAKHALSEVEGTARGPFLMCALITGSLAALGMTTGGRESRWI